MNVQFTRVSGAGHNADSTPRHTASAYSLTCHIAFTAIAFLVAAVTSERNPLAAAVALVTGVMSIFVLLARISPGSSGSPRERMGIPQMDRGCSPQGPWSEAANSRGALRRAANAAILPSNTSPIAVSPFQQGGTSIVEAANRREGSPEMVPTVQFPYRSPSSPRAVPPTTASTIEEAAGRRVETHQGMVQNPPRANSTPSNQAPHNAQRLMGSLSRGPSSCAGFGGFGTGVSSSRSLNKSPSPVGSIIPAPSNRGASSSASEIVEAAARR